MTLASVLGQTRAVEALRSALRSDSVHHAYLFGGPEGVGKELCAIGFAQALNCLQSPGEGCGECHSCTRIARRSHPDVTWLMPEEEQVARKLAGRSDFAQTPSRDIRVEQVRKLQDRLSFHALEAKTKVAILASAQAMNLQAQNAFLKTLEEPPAQTVLVLIASSPDKLLPTIRSRCSKVHFAPLPTALLEERVKQERGLDSTTASLVAVRAGGSLSRALGFDLKRLARRREVIEQFEALARDDAKGWLRFAEEQGGSRDDAEEALGILTTWTRDVGVHKAGGAQLANQDLLALATTAADRSSEAGLHRQQLLIDQALNAVAARHGAPRLQLERLLIELLA